jgi:antirestriction protein ArdC
MQSVNQIGTSTQTQGKAKARDLKASISASIDALAQAVDAVRASETFKQFLAMQARFHRYSWHNSILIATQRPDASQVAGYRTWQSMGRQVRKGEKGIAIIAPCPFKREVKKSESEAETVDGIFFRVVHVFDIAQTDGEELPTVDVPTVDAMADKLLADLCRVAVSRGIRVDFKPLSGGTFGVSKSGAIDIDNRHASGQQAKTLAHELAHEALHWKIDGPITRNIAELEAEAVAFVVCMHFGLDVEVRASRYIAVWQGDSKGLRASMDRIAKTARDIIDNVESGSESVMGVAA